MSGIPALQVERERTRALSNVLEACRIWCAAGSCGSSCPTPQGRNPKRRPAVVLSPAQDIEAGGPIVV
jgi:hypothetical protein